MNLENCVVWTVEKVKSGGVQMIPFDGLMKCALCDFSV